MPTAVVPHSTRTGKRHLVNTHDIIPFLSGAPPPPPPRPDRIKGKKLSRKMVIQYIKMMGGFRDQVL